MPGAARVGDIGSAHGCFAPTPIIAASSHVLINGLPAAKGMHSRPMAAAARASTAVTRAPLLAAQQGYGLTANPPPV